MPVLDELALVWNLMARRPGIRVDDRLGLVPSVTLLMVALRADGGVGPFESGRVV